jgi:hypothetical protein
VGSWQADTPRGTDAGIAVVFVRSGTSWAMETVLVASDGAASDRFGYAVALSGDGARALVGAPWDDEPVMNAGSARVWSRTGSSWTEHATLTGSTAGAASLAGYAVALSADASRAVVGANEGDAAWLFALP